MINGTIHGAAQGATRVRAGVRPPASQPSDPGSCCGGGGTGGSATNPGLCCGDLAFTSMGERSEGTKNVHRCGFWLVESFLLLIRTIVDVLELLC